MQILFTKSESILSKVIRAVTGEPVSHCAIQDGLYVYHSNLRGVIIEPSEYFREHSEVVFSVHVLEDRKKVLNIVTKNSHKMYDFGALLYLGLRYLLPCLPKKNLWQTSDMYLCTEWVTSVINNKEDSEITPYQLYLRLSKKEK